MAAAITTFATTAEQQVLETLNRVRALISIYTDANPSTSLQGLSISPQIDAVNNLATFTVTLPLTQTNTAGGGISFDSLRVLGDHVELPLLINGQPFTINGAPILI